MATIIHFIFSTILHMCRVSRSILYCNQTENNGLNYGIWCSFNEIIFRMSLEFYAYNAGASMCALNREASLLNKPVCCSYQLRWKFDWLCNGEKCNTGFRHCGICEGNCQLPARVRASTTSSILTFSAEFTGHRWIPLTAASDAELWCFLWSEQTVE